jgi:hypothetical protein
MTKQTKPYELINIIAILKANHSLTVITYYNQHYNFDKTYTLVPADPKFATAADIILQNNSKTKSFLLSAKSNNLRCIRRRRFIRVILK